MPCSRMTKIFVHQHGLVISADAKVGSIATVAQTLTYGFEEVLRVEDVDSVVKLKIRALQSG